MHEASLIENMLLLAEESLKSYQVSKVNSLKLCVGTFAGVMEGAMQAAFEAATQDGIFKGSKLIINKLPAKARCYSCGQIDQIEKLPYQCSRCGDNMPELSGGRELYLEAIDFEEAGENNGIEA